MTRKHLPRPRIQRAFVHWFRENHDRFKMPVRVAKISAKRVELHFQGLPNNLSACLSPYELNVYVSWQGEPWDMLSSLEASPFHTAEGWKCKQCVLENGDLAGLFPSRESLWQHHLFKPFLRWVNEELAPARWLRVSGTVGATWAELIRDESALSSPSTTLHVIQQLKRITVGSANDGNTTVVSEWLIPLVRQGGQARP
jgi:hypothetical protein